MIKNCTNSIIAGTLLAFSTLLASCSSSQQFVQPSLTSSVSSKPQYLDNLTIKGPERSLALSNRSIDPCSAAIDPASGSTIKTKYAALLQVVPETIHNLSLYRFIDEWYGVRYRLGGNSKAGIDCSAFVQRAYEQVFGLNLLRTALDQFGMSNIIWRKEQCKEGDLVFFNIKGSRISHVGIYLMNNFFVHASSSNGIMISSLQDKYWSKYYACAGRVL
jgi:cell wall-associated NlpC family hydrolase